MEETLNDFEDELSDIHEDNLLTKIWFEPTATLNYIINNCPEKFVIPLLVLGGIGRAIDRASEKDMGDSMSTFAVLALAITMGGLFGWITYYVYAWGMSVTGKFINGDAEPETFRTIIAWALVPSVCALFLLVPELLLFGDDLFTSVQVNNSLYNDYMWVAFGLIEIALGIWTLVILVKGICLIQGFKTGKAILNLFLPILAIVVPITVFMLLYSLLTNLME